MRETRKRLNVNSMLQNNTKLITILSYYQDVSGGRIIRKPEKHVYRYK